MQNRNERKYEITCGHCHALFLGTYKQQWNQKNVGSTPYCSPTCHSAEISRRATENAFRQGLTLRKGVLRGPCKKCGQPFESKTDKPYCSLACYVSSDQFKEMSASNRVLSDEARARGAQKLRTGEYVQCAECSEEFYLPKNKLATRKFCTKVCYRSYMAKRFDRWVANPESMSLPQCYDEFLDKERLRCVVGGCDWEGLHLTTHMNMAHGVPSPDFKRAAGFNLKTGVIARPLAETLQSRKLTGVATDPMNDALLKARAAPRQPEILRYRSLEAREHQLKARALLGAGPQRYCVGCGAGFVQSTVFGRAMYCTIPCRDRHYSIVAKLARQSKRIGLDTPKP